MKTTVFIKLLLLLLLTACDKSSELSFEDSPDDNVQTIAALKTLCHGNSTVIRKDITIEGIISGNDFYGEFSKTLVLEDTSGGITLAVDGTNLADDFPVGAAVTLHCNGLTLGDYGGKIQIGGDPDGDYSVGRIPRKELDRYLRRNTNKDKLPVPAVLTFSQVASQHVDTYVRFDNIRLAESGTWCDSDPETAQPLTTERQMIDTEGGTFRVRTPATCTYAMEPVPQGTGSISGIIDYFNGKYTLRISDHRIDFSTVAALPTAYP